MLINPFKKPPITDYKKLINEINSLESKFVLLTDSEILIRSRKLEKQYQVEFDLNSIISQAFALTREASRRTLGLRHFDVQLMGGLVLNSGKIAEMKTGEGKTLVSTLPAYVNGLTKKGVHIVTVNDYLASRDQNVMGQVYRLLGLSTGLIQENMTVSERQTNYNTDITYATNNELGFDYLRDNMALKLDDVVLRPFNYCIVDEVDSVLIDEAQVPLILANSVERSIEKYIIASEIITYLEVNVHFTIDEKNKNVILNKQGALRVEEILGIKDLYNRNDPWIPYIINALKAATLFFKNVHYIIQNNQIVIVDQFTGRIMPNRQWSEGLHQAVEAKESIPISKDSETIASITYQNFFLLYPKLSGMTGTAKTSEVEFDKIYNLPVVEIPTNRPNLRVDLEDVLYKDELLKWNAIAQECKEVSLKTQPILIGTTTVEKSEMLAQLLDEYNLKYQVLNAKPENVRRESEIVAQAGKKGSITIATNMAGRGTDIILGGNIKFQVLKQLYIILVNSKSTKLASPSNVIFPLKKNLRVVSQKFLSVLDSLVNNDDFLSLSDIEILKILNKIEQITIYKNDYKYSIKFLFNELANFEKKSQELDSKIVKNIGGLYIIGTEKNDSRRVDNQLRGRCGRQGDPGLSKFFLSLEDRLLRIFGSSKIQTLMNNSFLDNEPLESNLLTKSLDAAQKKVEEAAYDSRKNLFEYDEILSKQRRIVYYERQKILESQSVKEQLLSYSEQLVTEIIKLGSETNFKYSIGFFENLLGPKFLKNISGNRNLEDFDSTELKVYFFEQFWVYYELKVLSYEILNIGTIRFLERIVILTYIDKEWKEHLQKMSLLRDAVGWRSYGQRNPLFEYTDEAYRLFKSRGLISRQLIIRDLIKAFIQ